MNPILALMLAIGIVGSNSLVLGPIAATVATSFQSVGASGVMVASALFGFGTAVGALALAPKADAFGLERALRYSLIALLAGFALSAVAPVFWVLCLGQALAGIASGVTLPCTYSLAAELAPKGRENETLGKVLLGWTLSMVVGVSVAAWIADALHWRGVYVLLVLGAWGLLICTRKIESSNKRPMQSAQTPWHALTLQGVMPALLSVALFMAAFYGVYGFLGTHLHTALQAKSTTAGLASLLYGLGFGAAVFLDKGLDYFGAAISRAVVFTALVINYIAIAYGSSVTIVLLGLCISWGVINHLGLNLLVAHLTAIQPDRRAAIMGLYSATTYLTMFAATLVFKYLYDAQGFHTVSLTAALCILPIACIALYTTTRAFKNSPSA